MADKVSCLNCLGLLVNLNTAWIDGERASLGVCIKKNFHIRETERYCKKHSSIDSKQLPHFLEYQRKKLKHTGNTLNMIEKHASRDTNEKRSKQ